MYIYVYIHIFTALGNQPYSAQQLSSLVGPRCHNTISGPLTTKKCMHPQRSPFSFSPSACVIQEGGGKMETFKQSKHHQALYAHWGTMSSVCNQVPFSLSPNLHSCRMFRQITIASSCLPC